MAAQRNGGGRRGQGQRELRECVNKPAGDIGHFLQGAEPQCLVPEQ